MALFFTLFAAGVLTILLPCILPLIPIVLGVSIAGRSKWWPVLTIAGMLVSFVGFTFLLFVVLDRFVEIADYLRIGTYYVLLLFGLGFFTQNKWLQWGGAILGSCFFWSKGPIAVAAAAAFGFIAMSIGARIASSIQSFGSAIQQKTVHEFGRDQPITAFIMGLTLGLVWVPCAGPALSFAFTLVRDEPGLMALALLTSYGLGTAFPLLLIGYGGQYAVHSVRFLSRFSGHVKKASGLLLIFAALAFQFHWFTAIEIWFVNNTSFGTIGTDIELKLFGEEVGEDMMKTDPDLISPTVAMPGSSGLPKLGRAPNEFAALGPWHNSQPFTMEQLRGKVVLIDFWTYSCINCIRTLPYIQGYWEKYGVVQSDGTIGIEHSPFVLIGVHTPEFVFEKSEKNVADAIKRHGLTYPVAQDNDFGTWKAFANHYWPAKYLIDADGYIRYEHFGEGAYEETDKAIASLLAGIGVETDEGSILPVGEQGSGRNRTPETYLGVRSWPSLGNGARNPVATPYDYAMPDERDLHKYYLAGTWQLADEERQVLMSDEGEIRMKFLGSEINLVLGLEEGVDSVEADVEVDGNFIKAFTVDRNDLFNLYSGEYGEHEIILRLHGKGVAGYAFTFGS